MVRGRSESKSAAGIVLLLLRVVILNLEGKGKTGGLFFGFRFEEAEGIKGQRVGTRGVVKRRRNRESICIHLHINLSSVREM